MITFTDQQTDLTVNLGDNVDFNWYWTGSGPFVVTIYKDEVVYGGTPVVIEENSYWFDITGISAGYFSDYYITVDNGDGVAISNIVTVSDGKTLSIASSNRSGHGVLRVRLTASLK